MKELSPPDSHFVNAASGWLELGLPEEARKELSHLSSGARQHPDVLGVEWDVFARERRWQEALAVADQILSADQTRPTGWINRSFALHELHRTAEARETLLPALPRFPSVGVIPYNLACYAAQLGNIAEARTWLRQAFEVDGRDLVLERARKDPDLASLRGELPGI